MDDTNLHGMTPQDAQAYILEFATSKRLTEKECETVKADILAWQQKQQLARSLGREDLVAAVDQRIAELTAKQANLELEIQDLAGKIEAMKRQIPGLKARERSVDPDLLLAEMEMTLGKSIDDIQKEQEIDGTLNSMSADEALKKLKDKLNNPEG